MNRAVSSTLLSLFLFLPYAMAETSSDKIVIALQAFLPEVESRPIEEICLEVREATGAQVAFAMGAEPHVTLGAWKVTREELTEAKQSLESADLATLAPVTIACRLDSKMEGGEKIGWFLVPEKGEARELASEFRSAIQEKLNWNYEDFGGRNASDWWPHLTLFAGPADKAELWKPFLNRLEAIETMRWNRVALVAFDKGIKTVLVRTLPE